MSNDQLDDRLRSFFESLEKSAGPPPDFESVATGPYRPEPTRFGTSSAVLASALAVLVLVSGLAWIVTHREATGSGAEPLLSTSLWSTWQLTSTAYNGEQLDVGATDRLWTFSRAVCETGEAEVPCDGGSALVVGRDMCNRFERRLQVDDAASRATWKPGDSYTFALCSNPVQRSIDVFMLDDSFSYLINGDSLTLHGTSDVSLHFVRVQNIADTGQPGGSPAGSGEVTPPPVLTTEPVIP